MFSENFVFCEYTRDLRLKSELFDLRSAYANSRDFFAELVRPRHNQTKQKSTLKGCLSPLRPKSFRRNVCNPPLGAEWNCDKVAYGIKPQGDAYTRLRVMPYAFGDSIQCASALIPCQACGLDKKITSELKSSDVIFFGDPYGNRTHVSSVRG